MAASSTVPAVSPYVVLVYEYDTTGDVAARRAPYRPEHLALLREFHDRGDLRIAGALGDPLDGGLLVFRGSSPAAAEDFVSRDPYVQSGLVTRWTLRPWSVVVGEA